MPGIVILATDLEVSTENYLQEEESQARQEILSRDAEIKTLRKDLKHCQVYIIL